MEVPCFLYVSVETLPTLSNFISPLCVGDRSSQTEWQRRLSEAVLPLM